MLTDEIEEAKVVENKEQSPEAASLQERLTRATEQKTPGAEASTEKVKRFWETSDDDFIKEEKKVTEPAASETENTEPVQPKLSEKLKNASADTAVGALNVMLTGAFTPIQNFKLKKKLKKRFTEPEQILIEEKLIDLELEDLEDVKEKQIKKRLNNILNKYEKKLAAIPMTASEKEEFHEACKNYMDITGKSLPPGLFLGMSLTQIVGNRVIDVATD